MYVLDTFLISIPSIYYLSPLILCWHWARGGEPRGQMAISSHAWLFTYINLNISASTVCCSRFCPKWLDVPLLHPVPDADAGGHVDVFCAVWARSSDCHLLCCVGWSCQTQRGLLRRLPTSYAASFCKRCWCGKKTVGGQWETGETGLMVEWTGSLFIILFMVMYFFFKYVIH